MPDDVLIGALGGAAEGAALGSSFGPIGTVVGGVLGGLGGIAGGKSKKYARKAQKQERKLERTKIALQRRDLILEAYRARAETVAAGASEDEAAGSSSPMGAAGSLGSTLNFNLKYFDQQAKRITKRDKYMSKAGKYKSYAEAFGGLIDLAGSSAGFFPGKTPTSTTAPIGQSHRANFNPNIYGD